MDENWNATKYSDCEGTKQLFVCTKKMAITTMARIYPILTRMLCQFKMPVSFLKPKKPSREKIPSSNNSSESDTSIYESSDDAADSKGCHTPKKSNDLNIKTRFLARSIQITE